MRALVIYESEFGATRAVAEAIGRGLRVTGEAEVVDSRDGLAAAPGQHAASRAARRCARCP